MSLDVASLTLAVDASQVDKGAASLERLTAAGAKTEAKAKDINASFNLPGLKSASSQMSVMSDEVQKLLNRYDPLGTKLRALQSDFALLRQKMGDSVDPGVMRAFQGLEDDLMKTKTLMQQAGAAGEEGFGQIEKAAGKGAFATAQARRELIVLGHEAISGNFSRIPGSLMVLAERTGASVGLLGGLVAAGLAAVGVIGYLAVKSDLAARAMEGLNRQFEASGNSFAVSTGQITALVNQLAKLPGVSKDAAEKTVAEFARIPQIGDSMRVKLLNLAPDIAAAFGVDIPKAAKTLADSFKNPEEGAKKLDSELNFLTTSQLIAIHNFELQGRTLDAQRVLYDALNLRVQGLSKEGLTPMQMALSNLTHSWDDFMQSLGNSSALSTAVNIIGFMVDRLTAFVEKMQFIIDHPIANAFGPMGLFLASKLDNGSTSTHGASGSWASQPTNQNPAQDTQLFIKTQTELAEAYKGTGREISELQLKAKGFLDAQQALRAENQQGTAAYKLLGEAIQDINKQIADKSEALTHAKALAEAHVGVVKAESDMIAKNQQEADKLALAQLDLKYAMLTEKDQAYYAQKLAILNHSADAEIAAITKEMQAQAKAFNGDIDPVKKQNDLAKLIDLEGKYSDALNKRATVEGTISVEAAKALTAAEKENDKIGHEKDDQDTKAYAVIIDSTNALIDKASHVEFENSLIGKSKDLVADLTQHEYDETIAKLESTKATIAATTADQFQINRIQDKIDAMNRLESAQAANVSLKKMAADTKQFWDSVDSTAHKVWTDVWEGGNKAFKNIGQTIKSAILDLLYQMTIKKWILSIGLSVTGSDIANAASATASSATSSGFSGIINSIGSLSTNTTSAIESLGMKLYDGSGSMTSALGDFLGNNASSITTALGYVGAGVSLLRGDIKGAAIQGIATTIGSFTPLGPIGGAVIGAVASSLLGGAFGSHVMRPKAYANTSVSASGFNTTSAWNNGEGASNTVATSTGSYMAQSIQNLAQVFGGVVTQAFNIGTAYNGKYKHTETFIGSGARQGAGDFVFSPGQESDAASMAFFTAVKKGFVSLDPYLNRIISASNITLATATSALNDLQTLKTTYESLKQMPVIFASVARAIANTATIADLSAITARINAIGTYYNLFYSDSQKIIDSTKSLTSKFTSLNLVLPTSRDAFKSLVDGIDTTKASGLSLFNTLIDLAPTMDTYYKALEAQAGATSQAADAAKQLADNLSTDGFATLVDYTRAQMNIRNGIPGFASGGDFGGGLRIVGENGPELESTGPSHITNNSDLMTALRNPAANQQALIDEIRRLRADMQAQNLADVKANQLTARILDKFDHDGLPPTRT